MDLELKDRRFLITGGSAGLGYALAELLVAEGARVAICAREADRLAKAAERLRARGGEVVALAGDVTSPEQARGLVEAIERGWGRLDGLVNNAGALSAGRFEESSDAIWEADLALKLIGAARLTRLALPLIRAAGGGVVLSTL